jgi:hypothetical protein
MVKEIDLGLKLLHSDLQILLIPSSIKIFELEYRIKHCTKLEDTTLNL